MTKFTKKEDQYYLAVLDVVAFGFRLGKSIEEILADVREAPNHLKNPIQNS